MNSAKEYRSPEYLSPSEAARRLGVSAKALRLYEQRGLVTPLRNTAGWRVYGPAEMDRAAEIAAFRALGLSLAQVARVLEGDARDLGPALAAHQSALEGKIRQLAFEMEKVRGLRADLNGGRAPTTRDIARLLDPEGAFPVAFALPYPWGGECFALRGVRALTYIVGPLGCGKTRLAQRLAEALPGAAYIGLERAADGGAAAQARRVADPALAARVEQALAMLVENGAAVTPALVVLLTELESAGPTVLVVDMVEQRLDEPTQEALIVHLRHRRADRRPLFLMTRSSAILDLADLGPDEAIILCPANHSPPTFVAPYPGAPGYEAVATCLATPAVRARTAGVVAWRPAAS